MRTPPLASHVPCGNAWRGSMLSTVQFVLLVFGLCIFPVHGESPAEGDAGDKKTFGGYVLPQGEENALQYAFTEVLRQIVYEYAEAVSNIQIALWAGDDGKVTLRVIDYKDSTFVDGEQRLFDKTKVVGKEVSFELPLLGADKFRLPQPEATTPELRGLLHGIQEDLLPLLFPGLPADGKLKKGVKWGDPIGQDDLGSFGNHPKATSWEVTEEYTPFPNRQIVVLEARKNDLYWKKEKQERISRTTGGNERAARQCRTVHYDIAAKRVRAAMCWSLYDDVLDPESGTSREFTYETVLINEIPNPRLQGDPPDIYRIEKKAKGKEQ